VELDCGVVERLKISDTAHWGVNSFTPCLNTCPEVHRLLAGLVGTDSFCRVGMEEFITELEVIMSERTGVWRRSKSGG
jgi:hypothetical protein